MTSVTSTVVLIVGAFVITGGNVVSNAGTVVLTGGNVFLTGGNVLLTGGNVLLTGGNVLLNPVTIKGVRVVFGRVTMVVALVVVVRKGDKVWESPSVIFGLEGVSYVGMIGVKRSSTVVSEIQEHV